MRVAIFCLFIVLFSSLPLQSQVSADEEENLTPDYINNVFYYKRLDYMRHSHDRARMLHREGFGGMLGGIFSVMYDFNYGQDMDRLRSAPMLLGAALGDGDKKRWGFHFLLYGTGNASIGTTDWKNRKYDREFKRTISPHRFRAYSVGGSVDLWLISLTADATWANGVPSVYGRVFVPFLRTHVGVGSSQFDEVIDPVSEQKKIIQSEIFNIDHLTFATSLIPYFNVGLKVFRLTQRRYAPNFSMAAHQFVNKSRWGTMNWDADIFFETRGGKVRELTDLEDFEARFTLHRLFWDTNDWDDLPITFRGSIYLGLSYKSEVDFLDNTLSESGMVYNGQNGFGMELGVGLRVLGFRKFGFEEDTYVKLSYYNNFSGYYERFPGMRQGIKFRVLL